MKKAIVALLALLTLLSTVVVVGTQDTLDVDVDCYRRHGWWSSRDCLDYLLDDEFQQIEDFINVHNSLWSKDEIGGGGIAFSRVTKYLYGEFMEFLDTVFVPREEYLALQDRVDALTILNEGGVVEVDVMTTQVRAWRTGETQHYNGWICYPNFGECFRKE